MHPPTVNTAGSQLRRSSASRSYRPSGTSCGSASSSPEYVRSTVDTIVQWITFHASGVMGSASRDGEGSRSRSFPSRTAAVSKPWMCASYIGEWLR